MRGGRTGSRSLFVALLVYLVLFAATDAATPDHFIRIAPFTALAPFVASALLSLRQTAVIAVLCVTLITVEYAFVIDGVSPANRWLILLYTPVAGAISLVICRGRLEREERVRATSEAAQRLLLRELPLRADDVVVSGFYITSDHGALIGGDIYEVLSTPFGTRAVIGDVRGKGLPAMGAGAAVLTAFREGAYQEPKLRTVVERMDQGLMRYGRRVQNDELFVTALVLEIADPETVRIIDCGHVPPFIIGDGDVMEVWIEEPGLPLGMSDLVDEQRRVLDLKMTSGGRLLACTDGVSEARDAAGVFYPLADRLRRWPDLPTDRMLALLRADLERHSPGELSDDVAVLVVDRRGADAGILQPGARIP
jgi:hypothetical protein